MKCKACTSGVSEDGVKVLNKLRPEILSDVLVPHLHVRRDFGSSEFYVQNCDCADDETHDPFCEVRLSGVSVNDDRSTNDFGRARSALEKVYVRNIQLSRLAELPPVELTVSIMLDKALSNGSTLVEGPPVMVRGALHTRP